MRNWERNIRNTLYRIRRWEFWTESVIYYPLFPIWLIWSFRNRSLFFFNAINPGLPYGGLTMDSKMEIYGKMPKGSYPNTLYVNTKDRLNRFGLERRMTERGLSFPIILKPDIGFKGLGVNLVHDSAALKEQVAKQQWPFLLQEYIPYKHEVGIFYVKLPNEKEPRITGMVSKEFLSVTGDEVSSLMELIDANPRCRLQYKRLKKEIPEQEFERILDKGEFKILVPIGSHTRGALFQDRSEAVSDKLEAKVKEICKPVDGFYYGRLDILYRDWESLMAGENLKVIEINGAGSEPTHIYDPKHSLLFAWKEIIRHGILMYRIARQNRKLGYHFLSHKEGMEMMRNHRELARFLSTL